MSVAQDYLSYYENNYNGEMEGLSAEVQEGLCRLTEEMEDELSRTPTAAQSRVREEFRVKIRGVLGK